ncbi:MAG: sigma-54-dependent Fis family transcriptional regulator [Candidatus Rokubacteria bacterium]|nr:sigma-54-dependent Fis family transcriptional regulator [Candidatus Rokubacteria bacterium]
MRHGKVLVVDDEAAERDGLARLVGQWGYEVETAGSGEEALTLVESQHPAVVVTDLVLPEMDGLTLLEKLKETGRPPIVLLVTGQGTVETAVEAMRRGALDYLTKPVDTTRLQVLLEKSIEQESLSREVNFLRHQLRQKGSFGQLVGQAKSMQEVYRWIELAATSNAPVLVFGESGTGKELVARTVHELSNRRNKPFVAINCAAIPETLIESELFGHERGAFTGATERRLGCFELADGGTLFLDEIAEMDNSTQAKLLRVLQEGSFRRVGGGKQEIQVDVRVVAATNRIPNEAISTNQLREDLFYRLNVFSIALPSLRERKDDIPLLSRTFVEEFNRQDNRAVRGLTAEAEKALDRYSWPGNVRELRNVIQRAVVLSGSGLIDVEHLPDNVLKGIAPTPNAAVAGSIRTIREIEREEILRALDETRQDKRKAAALLGISLKTLYNKLAKYGIQAVKSARIT